ncbi:hypothetical protein BX616_000492 [Lobosporangium transversale]|nr:hypothetical protein BX616_000492 [Lobosporangium transversale]
MTSSRVPPSDYQHGFSVIDSIMSDVDPSIGPTNPTSASPSQSPLTVSAGIGGIQQQTQQQHPQFHIEAIDVASTFFPSYSSGAILGGQPSLLPAPQQQFHGQHQQQPQYQQQEGQQNWMWSSGPDSLYPDGVDPFLQSTSGQYQQRQESLIDNPEFHHQGASDLLPWQATGLGFPIDPNSMALQPPQHASASASMDSSTLPSSPNPGNNERARRRSFKARGLLSTPISLSGGDTSAPFSTDHRRPRARSTTSSPNIHILSEPIPAVQAPLSQATTVLTPPTMMGWEQGRAAGMHEDIYSPTSTATSTTTTSMDYFNATNSFEDSMVLPTILPPSDSIVAQSSLANSANHFGFDLTTLLSSSIGALRFHEGLSPPLTTRSAISSPTPSSCSLSASPSPTLSTTAVAAVDPGATPITGTGVVETVNVFGTPHSVKMKQVLLPPLTPCPVSGCSKAFSKTYNLNTHIKNQHQLDPQDLNPSMPLSPQPSSVSSSPSPQSASLKSFSTSPPPAVPYGLALSPGSNSVSGGSTSAQAKTFPCHLCTRIFSRKHDLQRHIRVHTGSKPYVCMSCQKAFARTDALCRHYKVEEACRNVVVQLEADQSIRKLQQSQVQQSLQLEVEELQKAQRLRQQMQQQRRQQQQHQPQGKEQQGDMEQLQQMEQQQWQESQQS